MITPGNTFGRYTLMGRIAVGGMAEVYRGKFTGEKGFEKPVVIKKMLPQLASDEQMVQFFIDEARLSALLQHENIVCIYDFGELEGTYYLAMEYLQGQDLNHILKRSIDLDSPPSLGHILWIVSKLCDGLGYAHSLKDLTGRPLDIIHRDISPQNVFVTYDGNVKVLDFGVAKTAMQTTLTRVGMAKGKMAYMSPEQLDAKNIDHRSDIFAVGILMYEMVAQSRMYSGDTTAEIFEQVMRAEFEPLENRVPDLDPNLAAIIRKALQKDPEDRFQSCHEMQTAIEDCIFKLSLRPSNKTLSEYVVGLFPEHGSDGQWVSGSGSSAFDGDATVAMEKTQYLSGKTVAFDSGSEARAGDAGPQPPSSSRQNRKSAPQPKAEPLKKRRRVNNRGAGSKMRAVVYGALVLLSALVLAGVYFSGRGPADAPETTMKIVQKDGGGEPDKSSAPWWRIGSRDGTSKPGSGSKGLEGEYEKISYKYAELAEDALKQSRYGDARSLTAEGLALNPGDERLLGLDRQITLAELVQKAENRIQVNQLTSPENDCAAYYFAEASKLDPGSIAVRKGYEKVAFKFGDLAEDALKQSRFNDARCLTAEGLGFIPGDERLLELNRQINFEELLYQAEERIEASQLASPENDCAAYYYAEALKLYPDSRAAKDGYEKIAVKYADLAENALKLSQFDKARSLTVRGLSFGPDNRRLLGLDKQIKAELLQKAENCIEANQLATPENDSAAYYYNEVERLYPGSGAVETGYKKIAGRYAALADSALERGQYDNAKSFTMKGLEFKSDDQRLLGLDSKIKAALLQKAESCIEANQLTTPENDCAVYYYQKVTRLYPGSGALEKGHEKIAGKYADLAEDAMAQYQFDSARYLTAKGLEFGPDDERLQALDKQLSKNKVGLFFKNIGKGIKETID